MKMVTDCAVLENFGIFLVLADKSLFAYHIEALVPSSPQKIHRHQTPLKLKDNVQFFRVGSLLGLTLVILMKKKSVGMQFGTHIIPLALTIHPSKTEWFRSYREFCLPYDAFDAIFLETKIAISCTKGFQIVDLLQYVSAIVPKAWEDERFSSLAQRCQSCRPMGIFRTSGDDFLLCYKKFGLYVNRHGDPSPTRPPRAVEWQETAKQVAFHAPYILLFNSRFIEVRDVHTARLAQIIPGDDMHCIWGGAGVTPRRNDNLAEYFQEAKVYGVKTPPEELYHGRRAPRTVAQHVFQLMPTILPHQSSGRGGSSPTNLNLAPSFSIRRHSRWEMEPGSIFSLGQENNTDGSCG
ncbi:CNH domain-containing protein [Mycena sanguinolenta]|nr:CNH domain-containing protein [Mycena sanguinolenta]